jgi:membrane peptidoglycan carboxypeptidase
MGVVAGLLVAGLAVPTVFSLGVGVRDTADWFNDTPELTAAPIPQTSTLLAADGSTIATFYTENRTELASLKDTSPIARQAVLAIEDDRFYQHGALDARGTIRALVNDLHSGANTQGGSDITQQYVKNLLEETATTKAERDAAQAVTPARKLRELRYAITVEHELSKDEILRRYLNIAYFGDGAYGIEAAAEHYFSVHASHLTLGQGAMLAGLVRDPSGYDPVTHPAQGKARRDVVLQRMADLGWISQQDAAAAEARPLDLHVSQTPNGCVDSKAPFFCQYAEDEILTNPVFGATPTARQATLNTGGLTIHTSLDWQAQKAAQSAVNDHVPPKNDANIASAEALVQPGTGLIRGIAQDRSMGSDKQRGKTWIDFAADSDHGGSIGMPSGSTFKIFTLATALDQGMPFGTQLYAPNDFTPTGFRDCAGKNVSDPNADLHNAGDGEGGKEMSLVTATWNSVNTFFLTLERQVGLCDVAQMAAKLGMKQATGKPLQQYPSLTLGFNAVSPVDMAAAYAAFAARGKYCHPIVFTKITNSAGQNVKVPSAGCHQVIDQSVADAVNYILRGVLTRGTAAGQGIGRPAAGKTGTMDDFASAWFAGYTPDLASAVWVGDPRGGFQHPMDSLVMDGTDYGEVFGATIPAPIWHDTMQDALQGVPEHDFVHPQDQYFSEGDGLPETAIPDVRGRSVSSAIRTLEAAGFTTSVDPSPVASMTYPKGTVADTSPSAGDTAAPGTSITIYVSAGDGLDNNPPHNPSPFPTGFPTGLPTGGPGN